MASDELRPVSGLIAAADRHDGEFLTGIGGEPLDGRRLVVADLTPGRREPQQCRLPNGGELAQFERSAAIESRDRDLWNGGAGDLNVARGAAPWLVSTSASPAAASRTRVTIDRFMAPVPRPGVRGGR
jgi:hypothetical protein